MIHEKDDESALMLYIVIVAFGALFGVGLVAAFLGVGAAFVYIGTNYGAVPVFLLIGAFVGGLLGLAAAAKATKSENQHEYQ